MPNDLNPSLESTLALADSPEGRWVTLSSGAHVLIKDGAIAEGPAHLKGKTLDEVAKDGHHVKAVHPDFEPLRPAWERAASKMSNARLKRGVQDESISATHPMGKDIMRKELEKRGVIVKHAVSASDEDLSLADNPRLSQCPSCDSYDVTRMPGGEKVGPSDRCKRCGNQWAHKPGTLTAEQVNAPDEMALADNEGGSPLAAADSYILQLDDTGEGTPLPLSLEGFPKTNAAGKPIHYRRMKVAEIGDWTNRANGEPLPIPASRADEWIRNAAAMAAAGIKPFVTTKHVYDKFGCFTAPDARDTLGYVERLERDEKNVYSVVSLHGDESLDVAAKNSRSIGVGRRDSIDDRGNIYAGETLHHLAIVPNPALTGLGDMAAIAASADATPQNIPVYELSQSSSQTAVIGRKGMCMNKEIAQKVRAALSLSADAVPDNQLDDKTAEKALALSDETVSLTKERDALKAERDKLAKERDDAKAEAASKSQEVLSLSAGDPNRLDPVNLAAFEMNADTLKAAAISSGAITPADADSLTSLLRGKDGKVTRLALSASGENQHPLEFNLWRVLSKLATPIRTGNVIPKGATVATPAIAASADGKPKAPLTEAEYKAQMAKSGYESTHDDYVKYLQRPRSVA